jgi:hypothetical protein
MEIKVLIEAPELASSITALAQAISGNGLGLKKDIGQKDPTSLSDAEVVEPLPNGDDPTKYTMFQDMAKAAQKLRDADAKVYAKVLKKYVEPGKKYSAIHPKDWGKAIKDFKTALAKLEDVEDEDVEEDSNIATELMYYYNPENDEVGIIKKGEELLEDVDYLSKAEYLKKKKALETAAEEEEDYEEVEDVEEPRLSVGELRALAAKAKNAGVSVGAIMKKIAGVTKISAIPQEKYNAFEDALKEAMEG